MTELGESGVLNSSSGKVEMAGFSRITINPKVMGGKPCIRRMRITVGMIAGQIGAGVTVEEMLEDYAYLEREDIHQAVEYAKLYIHKVYCPCCGSTTLDRLGQYELCDDCGWEDDPLQSADPDNTKGYNILSLNDAKIALSRGETLPLPSNVQILDLGKDA